MPPRGDGGSETGQRHAENIPQFYEPEGNSNARTGTDSSVSEASASGHVSMVTSHPQVSVRALMMHHHHHHHRPRVGGGEYDATEDEFCDYEDDDEEEDDDASTDTLVMRTLTAIRRLVDK